MNFRQGTRARLFAQSRTAPVKDSTRCTFIFGTTRAGTLPAASNEDERKDRAVRRSHFNGVDPRSFLHLQSDLFTTMARRLVIGVLANVYLLSHVYSQDVPLPVRVSPSTKTYGPDGPWQAVTVKLGDPEQTIDLYPGGIFESTVFTTEVCDNIKARPCGSGGLYNDTASATLDDTSIRIEFDADWTSGAMYQPGKAQPVMEQIAFDDRNQVVADLSMNLVSNLETIYPDGSKYPVQVGQLALGAPADNQTFDSVNASLIPNYLQDKKFIPSSSYGLHIGSAALNLPLSLWLGGYDSSRAIGSVSSQPIPASSLFTIDLLDIGLGVDNGASPPNFTERQGVLAEGNSSITSSVPVTMNPGAPYMYLPNSTCAAMVKDLPVTYNAKFGLYFWNTQDPDYAKIITSPTLLSFTFRDSTENLTVKVPFQLLNLTLDAPLVTEPTSYFPCQPPNNATDYSLGRAFLQAAFIGVNWEKGNGNWFLAQAPGPNTALTPVQKPITSLTIDGSPANWTETWNTVWTPIPDSNSSPPPGASTDKTTKTTSRKSTVSGGAIAGIVIAVVAASVLFFTVGFFVRRKKQRRRGHGSQPAWWTPSEKPNPIEPPPLYQHEVEGSTPLPKGIHTLSEADSITPGQHEEGIRLHELSSNA